MHLETFIQNLSQTFGNILPGVLGAILILILGVIFAKILKKFLAKLLSKTGMDKLIKDGSFVPSKFLSKLVYFFVIILVFILTLEHLGISQVLAPLREMLNEFFGVIPNLIAVGIIVYVGYILAKIVSELVELSGNTIRSYIPKLNIPDGIDLVVVLKKIVFIFIFIPILIIAFEKLNITAISDPATDMLGKFIGAIPKIILATLILIVTVIGGKLLVSLLQSLLESLNLNEIAAKMNLDSVLGKSNLVKVISNIAYAFIIIMGLMTAVEQLEFTRLSKTINIVLNYAGNIIFGLTILAIGSWIANIAYNNYTKKDTDKFVGTIIRVAIMSVFLAIGLNAMGIAEDIINLAFGISLGTVALTIVLSFGLGGREAGGKFMDRILDKFK
ncbi:MAG: mechanosensitive ion channel [Bacteroidota bacterium]